MVLADDHKLVSQLLAAWRARSQELNAWLEADPKNESSWLWAIQLRICTYLTRRYGHADRGDGPDPGDETTRGGSPPPPGTARARVVDRGSSIDEDEHRERYRHRCRDTLHRLQPAVADARCQTLRHAATQLTLARERRRVRDVRRRRSWFAALSRRRFE